MWPRNTRRVVQCGTMGCGTSTEAAVEKLAAERAAGENAKLYLKMREVDPTDTQSRAFTLVIIAVDGIMPPRTSQFCLLPLPSPADRSKRGNEIRSESERVRSSTSRRSKEGSQIRSGSEQIRSGSSRRSKDGSQIRSGSERIRSGSSRRSKEGRETRSQSERIRSSDNSSNRSRKSPVSSSARDKFIQRTGATVVAKGKRDAGSSQNHTSIDSGGSGSSRRASQQRASSLHSSSWHASTSFDRRKARTLEEMLLPTP